MLKHVYDIYIFINKIVENEEREKEVVEKKKNTKQFQRTTIVTNQFKKKLFSFFDGEVQ